jgi:predicted transcriptional regulator YdeE
MIVVHAAMTMNSAARFSTTVFLALIVGFAVAAPAQEGGKPAPAARDIFEVIGIQARTNNAAEFTGYGEIPKLWQSLFTEGILSKIPDRVDQGVVAVYTNYAGDANGDCIYILGSKVKPGTTAPTGLVAITLPASRYLEFVTAKDPGEEVVPLTWQQIYTYFQNPANPPRAFKTDYEVYPEVSDPNAIQGHIFFIGVKP